ncbi:hypothetical protein AWB78_01615 [Caballeronia calidae]|uniref:Uncharacterized protein n=1 Tax=Caballeronia calidae TaxID=1777139 RepID=A0A158AG43_9BURK|nr:hypothetical protein [Caballeronia calidae]SAK56811.1 hypothetical protein AWB78_01615 [Caballeronia calidae]
MDMSLAWAASRRNLHDEGIGACQRVRIMALAHFADGEASRERIRALFHSPLGIYVSQAQREGCELRLEIDTASEDLAFTLRTLKRVMPEARVEGIAPRVFVHRVGTRGAS